MLLVDRRVRSQRRSPKRNRSESKRLVGTAAMLAVSVSCGGVVVLGGMEEDDVDVNDIDAERVLFFRKRLVAVLKRQHVVSFEKVWVGVAVD